MTRKTYEKFPNGKNSIHLIAIFPNGNVLFMVQAKKKTAA